MSVSIKKNKIDLEEANGLLSDLSKKHKEFSMMTSEDCDLFYKFSANQEYSYGNSWSYIVQGLYGIGDGLGYKFYDGEMICGFCFYPKIENPSQLAAFWVHPMGKNLPDTLKRFADLILKEYGIPSYIKKIPNDTYSNLLNIGFKSIDNFPWFSTSPSEDDTFPEMVLDIEKTLKITKSFANRRQLKRAFKNFIKFSTLLVEKNLSDHKEEAEIVTGKFFDYIQNTLNKDNISHSTDYYNLIHYKGAQDRVDAKIYFLDDKPVAYYFIEFCKNNEDSNLYANVHAMISDRGNYNTIADFLIFKIFENMQKKDIRYINLGGSETETLNDYKVKFRPAREIEMRWCCYI